MTEFPNTRESLLTRIADATDRDAWAEFVQVYRPVIYRMARRRGFQDADAQDLTQRVLMSVAKAIGDWESDSNRARFRTWLSRVVRNQIFDIFRKQSVDNFVGGTSLTSALQKHPQKVSDQEIDNEYRRAIFRQAASDIRHEFEDLTWTAFWLTAVDGVSVSTAAEQTNRKTASVYAARSRITKRLKQKIAELERES